ncbi:MAG: hypothetical protein COV67_06535 [Nitrospinae bacterium CG11_big_fil_rev_8_21_14_0_20_56_8]|nr:MAG: hypothetical protein COV67_06535 [Nitrospinae bacterium CG11_big_fil_rev_8_21_14_0_20_56_8]
MSRFVDNQNDTVTDTGTGLTWLKKDSRQLVQKWLHLERCKVFAEEKNREAFGGYSDWRVPSLDDVKTIFEKSYSNRDFGNNEIHIPPVFEKGGADNTWTDTVNGDRAMNFNLVKGRSSWINKFGEGPFAVRLVRGERKHSE